jgi:hypothetical protein
MKTLHLTLKKQWFDLIASGEKTEEYREVKLYWIRRLVQEFGHPHSCADFNFEYLGFLYSMDEAVHFDTVEFKNGYSRNAPMMRFKVRDITIDLGKEKWGAEPGKQYFVIKLGERI